MNFKTTLLIISLIFSYSITFGQSCEKIFHLKNGSIIRGVVIEEKPGIEYKLRTTDGNIFVFHVEEIETIVLVEEEISVEDNSPISNQGISIYSLNEVLFSGMFYDDVATYNIGIGSINGIGFNEHVYVGVGAEYQYFQEGYFIPVFLDLRLNLIPVKENSFFTFLNGGVAISGRRQSITVVKPYNDSSYEQAIEFENGFIGRMGFGYKTKIATNLSANFSFYYTAHSYATKAWLYDNVYYRDDGIYSLVGVKLGICIN